jgi:hypothetical protein
MKLLSWLLTPMGKRLLWVLFAILFYQSGLAFTVWLLEPESFQGGIEWLWILLFPVLLPAFFIVNRHLGCATGQCHSGQCELPDGRDNKDDFFGGGRMPG